MAVVTAEPEPPPPVYEAAVTAKPVACAEPAAFELPSLAATTHKLRLMPGDQPSAVLSITLAAIILNIVVTHGAAVHGKKSVRPAVTSLANPSCQTRGRGGFSVFFLMQSRVRKRVFTVR